MPAVNELTVPETGISGTPITGQLIVPSTGSIISCATIATNCTSLYWPDRPLVNVTTTSTVGTSVIVGNTYTGTGSTIYYPNDGTNSFYITNGTNATGIVNLYYTTTCNNQPTKIKRGPLIKKSVKNSIKRALNLLSDFGMEEDTKIFLGGETIEVSHPDSIFKFVLKKRRNTLLYFTEHSSHSTPFELSLYTKNGVYLANLCVVLDKSPILDIVFGIAAFVKSGNEEEILSKANFNQVTQDKKIRELVANEYPFLRKKLRLDTVDISGTLNANIGTGNIISNSLENIIQYI